MLEIWTYMGGKWLLRTLWHNIHMFIDILEFTVKKIDLGKTILKMLFQICEKMAYVSTKLLAKKTKKKHESVHNL